MLARQEKLEGTYAEWRAPAWDAIFCLGDGRPKQRTFQAWLGFYSNGLVHVTALARWRGRILSLCFFSSILYTCSTAESQLIGAFAAPAIRPFSYLFSTSDRCWARPVLFRFAFLFCSASCRAVRCACRFRPKNAYIAVRSHERRVPGAQGSDDWTFQFQV